MRDTLEEYFDRLWPLPRSLTGDANRRTLDILTELIPDLRQIEVPAGTECFDWNVPPEWNPHEAWIKDANGEVIVDFADNNLHLLGYSEPFEGTLSFEELEPHLYAIPEHPDWIPYLTSYYARRWGFCLTQRQLDSLDRNADYMVKVDTTLDDGGSMSVGEVILPGESSEEILFSTYICHPSLANNELSGPLVTAYVYNQLLQREHRRYTYRFVFVPETIGTIYYLSQHGLRFKEELAAGFVVTCVGDPGAFTYKKSRRGDSLPDRATLAVLGQTEDEFTVEEFFPGGSDERQYCSPGFDLPVGSLMRTRYGKYDEYHTSADDKSFVSFDAMVGTGDKFLEVIDLMENNDVYINTMPFGEPQLGKRGLYPTLGSQRQHGDAVQAMMWLLNLADGDHDLIEIVERSGASYRLLIELLPKLLEEGLLVRQGSGVGAAGTD